MPALGEDTNHVRQGVRPLFHQLQAGSGAGLLQGIAGHDLEAATLHIKERPRLANIQRFFLVGPTGHFPLDRGEPVARSDGYCSVKSSGWRDEVGCDDNDPALARAFLSSAELVQPLGE